MVLSGIVVPVESRVLIFRATNSRTPSGAWTAEGIRARRAAGVAEQVLALPSTKVEKEVAWGRGGG